MCGVCASVVFVCVWSVRECVACVVCVWLCGVRCVCVCGLCLSVMRV